MEMFSKMLEKQIFKINKINLNLLMELKSSFLSTYYKICWIFRVYCSLVVHPKQKNHTCTEKQ